VIQRESEINDPRVAKCFHEMLQKSCFEPTVCGINNEDFSIYTLLGAILLCFSGGLCHMWKCFPGARIQAKVSCSLYHGLSQDTLLLQTQ